MTASQDIDLVRAAKMERVKPLLRMDLPHQWRGGRVDFLTEALRRETGIADTENVSALGYDDETRALIMKHRDGLVLDCGAGSKSEYLPNVVCLEIVEYPSTDVLAVGEHLPFADGSFDAVLSIAVLEHVRDPFRCAAELVRVLKPGGDLLCAVPFLQPVHGYPHHYFNATHQGLRRLFAGLVEGVEVGVPIVGHPAYALHWIVASWADGLAPDMRARFLDLRLADLLRERALDVARGPFGAALSVAKQLELACGNVLTAVKPVPPPPPPPPPTERRGLAVTIGRLVERAFGERVRLRLGAAARAIGRRG